MDELVKNLRICSRCDFGQDCNACTQKTSSDFCCDELLHQAADAIEELIERLNHADDQIERLVNAAEDRRWIPVTERLPKENTSVLVYRQGDNRVMPTMRMDVCPYLGDGIFCMVGVTHWMPLPEPPKEGEA